MRPETPHRASLLEPVVPCDCSRVTARIQSVRLGEICDRQSTRSVDLISRWTPIAGTHSQPTKPVRLTLANAT